MKSGIYQITNQANGKRYIGSTGNLQMRWQQHLFALRHRQHHNPHLQAAFNKYGKDAFIFSVLEQTEIENLTEREQHYLNTLSPEYNILLIVGTSFRHSPESRVKISAATRGERNPSYGKPCSQETRARLRAANLGKRHSDETRQKMRDLWTPERRKEWGDRSRGRPVSKETRQKLSEAGKGRICSEETRAKLSGERNHHYGKHPSEETRAKMRAARRRRVVSDETRAKMSASMTAYWRRIHALSDDKKEVGGEFA